MEHRRFGPLAASSSQGNAVVEPDIFLTTAALAAAQAHQGAQRAPSDFHWRPPPDRANLPAMPSERAAELTAELERSVLRALRLQFSDINGTFFRSRLRPPIFRLTDSDQRLGSWLRESRTMEIARGLLLQHGWGTVVEVLKHEMAHQYVDEVLRADEAAHGPIFRSVCKERGFDASPHGVPQGMAAPTPILERIAKLLALAESPNEHEAQAAMSAARRLMLKHNLDAVRASGPRAYSYRHLGRPTGRVSEAERIVANILSDHFFVDAIWVPVWRPLEAKRGSVLEICGKLENLEMAEYVYAFLMQTSERLWKDHKNALGIRGNRDRRAYVAGVMAGFRDKLKAQARQEAREGLVWVGDADLDGFFRKRHPRIRWTRHASSGGSPAHAHGRQAGQRIVLHRGVKSGPGGTVGLLKS